MRRISTIGFLFIGNVAFLSHGAAPTPVLKVIDFSQCPVAELMSNGNLEQSDGGQLAGLNPYGDGYRIRDGEGRNGSIAAFCENTTGNQTRGLQWTFELNQTQPQPVRFCGWSRAEDVDGAADGNYSLYIDIVHSDGTSSWGHQIPFSVATHDWEEKTLFVMPDKPIRRLSCYALFRGHKGRVWFDDFSAFALIPPDGMYPFNGVHAQPMPTDVQSKNAKHYVSGDGFNVRINPRSGAISAIRIGDQTLALAEGPNGMLARDAAAGSDYYAFQDGACEALHLELDMKIISGENAIHFEGQVKDRTRKPRAISLVFVLPIAAEGWEWGDHLRGSRRIDANNEFVSLVDMGTGGNGKLSRYPFACIFSKEMGLGMGIDLGSPCQYRLGYSSGGGLFYLAFDFGLHPQTKHFPSAAPFQFVLYRTDPKWGFRSAADRYYRIFPEYFLVRSRDQGIWMPFTDVSTVAGWQDFGFKYHEGTNNIPFDDEAGILSFRYSEPSTWWMRMPKDTPRTYEAAMDMVNRFAASTTESSNSRRNAQALLSSGMFDENGRYQMKFRNEPWCDGAVFSLNPSPHLPGEITGANMMWNERTAERLYGATAKGEQDGEYLDSLEGYVTADLNFREEHFQHTTAPLTFTMDAHRPVLHKSFSQYEFTRYLGEQMHAREKLLFANGVPYRFSFLCPWLDVMGTETDWIRNRQFTPDSDEMMNYRRTMSGKKPYLFLMNTRFENMTTAYVENYFQYCLFYGMFPSMFSHNAAEDPYWRNPELYNRDRPLFQRYQPLIKRVAEAGWEPATYARANRASIRVERFGPDDEGNVFLTVWNGTSELQTYELRGEDALQGKGEWDELLSGRKGKWDNGLKSNCDGSATQVFCIRMQGI
jgi:hypothetical protein